MQTNPIKSFTYAFCILPLCFFSKLSFSADAKEEVRWFVNLVQVNNGKTFCAPRTATFQQASSALLNYTKAHPEFNGQLTDQQAVQGLAEIYPCTVLATPELANKDVSKVGAKNITVAPTGEFATIDTKPTMAIMQKLHSSSAHENESLVNQIVKDSGNYMPPVLFSLADFFYRQDDLDNAIFWFNAGRLRGNYDAMLCTDISARSAIPALTQQIPRDLIKKQFDDIPKLMNIINQVVKWDEVTPYNYDHRWISLHGMKAINSGLGINVQTESLTVSRDNWDNLAKKNRIQYAEALDKAINTVQKQRASTN